MKGFHILKPVSGLNKYELPIHHYEGNAQLGDLSSIEEWTKRSNSKLTILA